MAKKRKPKAKKKSSKKINPNRFQKQDGHSIFSFDPIRRDIFKWGLLTGAIGGIFMIIQNSIIWPILGVAIIVFVSNYRISKASQRIPRLHATVMSFLGIFIAMFAVIIVGTVVIAYIDAGVSNG